MHHHSIEVRPNQRAKRKSIFLRMLEALHRSRRRDAIRVLRRYRRLNAGRAQVRPAPPAPEFQKAEESSRNAHGNDTLAHAIRWARQNARNELA
jgi:hypothetical protein